MRQELGLRDQKQGLDKRHYDINHNIRTKENLGKRTSINKLKIYL